MGNTLDKGTDFKKESEEIIIVNTLEIKEKEEEKNSKFSQYFFRELSYSSSTANRRICKFTYAI